MKNTILFSLALGALLAGCNRSGSSKVSANDQADPNKPAYNSVASANATSSNPTASANLTASSSQSQMAATSSASAPAPNDSNSTASGAKLAVNARITEWKLAPNDIKDELQNSGRIVRSRSAGAGEPTGSMDSILIDQIKDKLKADNDTAGLKIDVSASKGHVTLKGTAQSLEQIGRAIALALDTGGVTQAESEIKLQSTP